MGKFKKIIVIPLSIPIIIDTVSLKTTTQWYSLFVNIGVAVVHCPSQSGNADHDPSRSLIDCDHHDDR